MLRKHRDRKQVLRFLVVGGSSVTVDLLCYALLLGSMDRMSAKGLAYAAGVLFGFAGNKLWTFESKRRSLAEPTLYGAVYAVTLFVNIAINSSVCALLEQFTAPVQTAQLIAFLLATGVTTLLNFMGLKYLAFRHAQLQSV